MNSLISGFLLGFSLIFAIGAQNTFILKQGLKREYVFTLCLISSISDAILILMGVYGFAAIVDKLPIFEQLARYGGALFLFVYGIFSFKKAFFGNETLITGKDNPPSLKAAILTCLAFTWLNPHVYLDTVALIGVISTNFAEEKTQFAIGAVLSSFVFFFSWGFGARLLAPLFQKTLSWKVFEFVIGLIMWTITFSLIKQDLLRFL